MNNIRPIRKMLGLTQSALAAGIGVTQGNVSHYENGQTVPPDVASRVVRFCREKGVTVTFDQVYAATPILPHAPRRRSKKEAAHA